MVRSQHAGRNAFTLFEMLVVLGIVVVLLTLLVPALRSVSATKDSLVCLTQLSSNGQVFQMYGADHQSLFPSEFRTKDDRPRAINWTFENSHQFSPSTQVVYWAYLLRDYVPGRAQSPPERTGASYASGSALAGLDAFATTLASPARQRWHKEAKEFAYPEAVSYPDIATATSFLYSPALFTDAGVWSPDAPPNVDQTFGPVRTSDVRTPSSKCVLAETYSWHSMRVEHLPTATFTGSVFHVLAVDGHAQKQRTADLALSMPYTADAWSEHEFDGITLPFIGTVGGHQGVDWR